MYTRAMKRILFFSGIFIFIVGGIMVIKAIQSRHAKAEALSTLCQRFLVAEATLPQTRSEAILKTLTSSGGQASLLITWLQRQDQKAVATQHFIPTHDAVALSQVHIKGGSPTVLSAHFSITRYFSPRGSNTSVGTVTFWINAHDHHLAVEAVSFNTDPIQTPNTPDSFNLNIWHLIPAAPLPHGQ